MKTSTLLVSLSLLMVALSPIVLLFAVEAETPGPPLSVTATASGTDIVLEWSPPADGTTFVDGYRIYRGENSGNINVDLGPTTDNTFTDYNLDKGEEYFYQVAAYDDVDGEGTRSEVVSATIPTTVPGAIDNLVATRSCGQITLSWSAPDDDGGLAVNQYSIFRSDSMSAPSSPIATQGGTGYIERDIDAGRTYYYWVAASNSIGMGALSNMATASPLAANQPSAPTNLNAQDGIGSIQISWNAPDDDGGAEITEYRIYRATINVKPDNPIHTNSGGVLTYTDSTDLVIGTTYYYWVSAYNSAGEGEAAGPDTAVPQEPPEVPGAPSGFLATGGAGVVNLNWTAPNPGDSPITTYNIYRATTSAMPTSPTYTTSGISYTDSSVTNGLTYYYWVSAESIAGEGAATGPVTAIPGTVPGTPINLVASPGNGEVNLTWSAPSSNGGFLITEYRIYRSTSASLPDTPIGTSTTTNYRDEGLSNGVTYYYWVSAVNSKGEGQVGDMVTAVPAAVPSPPRNFQLTEGVGYVDLSWDVPSDPGSSPITSYSIYRGATSNIQSPMYTLITGTTFRDSNITNGVTYYYWVSAVSNSGIGERSTVLTITPAMERTTPSVPQNLNAELQNGTVSLRWAAPNSDGGATITQYLIYRGLTETNLVQIGSATELLYNDTNTIKGVTYYYAVSAVNEEGEGARSGVYEVTVPLSSVPSVPLDLKAEFVNGKVLLSWSAPTSDGGGDITGYKIYRGTSQATLSYITSVTGTSFEDTGRRDGVTYVYTVAAVNEAGDGPSDAPVTITVPKDSVVASPVGLVAIAGLAVVGVGAVLYLLRRNRLNP